MEKFFVEIPENYFRFESQSDWDLHRASYSPTYTNGQKRIIDNIYCPDKYPALGWPNGFRHDDGLTEEIWAFVYPVQN